MAMVEELSGSFVRFVEGNAELKRRIALLHGLDDSLDEIRTCGSSRVARACMCRRLVIHPSGPRSCRRSANLPTPRRPLFLIQREDEFASRLWPVPHPPPSPPPRREPSAPPRVHPEPSEPQRRGDAPVRGTSTAQFGALCVQQAPRHHQGVDLPALREQELLELNQRHRLVPPSRSLGAARPRPRRCARSTRRQAQKGGSCG